MMFLQKKFIKIKSLIIDNYVRWRITDPLLFLQTVAAIPTAKTRLDDIVYSELRQELELMIWLKSLLKIVSRLWKVTNASNEETSKYGIEVIDVRIRRVDLPQENEALFMLEWKLKGSGRQINFDQKEKKKRKKSEQLLIDKTVILQMLTKHSANSR